MLEKERFTEKQILEIKELYNYYDTNKSNGRITLKIPASITTMSRLKFFENEKEDALFLQVNRHLKAQERNYVQLKLYDSEGMHPMFNTYIFYIVLDKNGKVIDWFLNSA